MRIGIIDADLIDNGTRHPNLALMKISGYYKKQGYQVTLLENYMDIKLYDKVFISKVFNFTNIPGGITTLPNVVIGGTGFFEDGGENLPHEIEHHMPDYDLYKEYANRVIEQGRNRSIVSDYLDYSIGFTTRGCFRKCSFCVNRKYDRATMHSHVTEFIDTSRPYIYLWDDNFLAYSGWEKILDDLESTGKPFQFRQGIDIRLMTDKKAKRLSSTRYHGDFIFAFDHLEDRDLIEKNLKLWRRYSTKTTKLYVLCGYNSQDEHDILDTFERIKILMKYGCLPYIMRYESYKYSSWRTLYVQLARWCNQPQFFKKKSFRQFCEANQDYHKNPDTTCSAYQAMLDFEKAHPDIAKKYFDLRFDQENQYGISYGYGRKYANKQSCEICTAQQNNWEQAFLGEIPFNIVLDRYLQKEMDLECLSYSEISCIRYSKETIADWFCSVLLETPLYEFLNSVINIESVEEVLPSNIPQFSNMSDAYLNVPDILGKSGIDMTYDELGIYLDNGKEKNEAARRKYGENHSKLAALLDLIVIMAPNNVFKASISVFGKEFNKRSEDDKKKIIARLLFRIPIIQTILRKAISAEVDIEEELVGLSLQTRKRRKTNITSIIKFIYDESNDSELALRKALERIRGWQ